KLGSNNEKLECKDMEIKELTDDLESKEEELESKDVEIKELTEYLESKDKEIVHLAQIADTRVKENMNLTVDLSNLKVEYENYKGTRRTVLAHGENVLATEIPSPCE